MVDRSKAFLRNTFGAHQKDSSIFSVLFGTESVLLEDELNEQQWNRIEQIADLLKYQYVSGISDDYYLRTTDGENMFYIQSKNQDPVSFLIDGYHFKVGHNFGDDPTKYNLPNDVWPSDDKLIFKLNNANQTTDRVDIVMLEMWFQIISYQDIFYKFGGVDTKTLINEFLDERTKEETSRRVQLRWRVRVLDNANTIENVYATLYNGNNSYAPFELLENGIYVAKTKIQHNAQGNIIAGDKIYGVPLFKVLRPAGNNKIMLGDITDIIPYSNFRVMDITVKKDVVIEGDLKVLGNYTMPTSTYEYEQQQSSNVWKITHGLNKYPSVTVIDSGGNQLIGDVAFPDRDNVIISFTTPFSGRAILN